MKNFSLAAALLAAFFLNGTVAQAAEPTSDECFEAASPALCQQAKHPGMALPPVPKMICVAVEQPQKATVVFAFFGKDGKQLNLGRENHSLVKQASDQVCTGRGFWEETIHLGGYIIVCNLDDPFTGVKGNHTTMNTSVVQMVLEHGGTRRDHDEYVCLYGGRDECVAYNATRKKA